MSPRSFNAWELGSDSPHAAPRLFGTGKALDELEALGLVVGQAGLEEHGVHPELRVQEGHVAVHLDKEVDTLVPLVKVRVIMGQGLRAPWASESPPRCHLETGERAG